MSIIISHIHIILHYVYIINIYIHSAIHPTPKGMGFPHKLFVNEHFRNVTPASTTGPFFSKNVSPLLTIMRMFSIVSLFGFISSGPADVIAPLGFLYQVSYVTTLHALFIDSSSSPCIPSIKYKAFPKPYWSAFSKSYGISPFFMRESM